MAVRFMLLAFTVATVASGCADSQRQVDHTHQPLGRVEAAGKDIPTHSPPPGCTIDCFPCFPVFAEHYFCDAEGTAWYCDPNPPTACEEVTSDGAVPRWQLADVSCGCIDADGNLVEGEACGR